MIEPEEAAATSAELWASGVEHLSPFAAGPPPPGLGPSSGQSRQRAMLLAFSRCPHELEEAILSSPPAQEAKARNVDVRPAWAGGAKVLLRARRRRAARAQAKVPRCRFDSARIFLRELLHRRPESGPSHRYPTAGMRTNPHSLKTNISRALPHIAASVKTRAFRAGVVPQKGCWLLSGRRQKAEGRRAEGRGRRIVSSGGGGRGAQARGQKWCDAPSAPLACDAYLPTSFEAPET